MFPKRSLIVGCALALLNGCSTISGWFPDKQKQYQYSTEIPPLEIPPEMDSSTIDGVAQKRPDWQSPAESTETKAGVESSGSEIPAAPPTEMSPATAKAYKAGKGHPPPVLAQSSEDVPLIEVQAPFDIAWAEVNKALGRMKLEITDQNRSDGVYFVRYGDKPYEDRGFFGDVAEMFGNEPEGSKEYRIKLEQKGEATSIYVLDTDGKPQRSGSGLKLLKRLHETMQNTGLGSKGEKAETPAP